LGVAVEDEEEGTMGNQGMNGHDSSSEKRGAHDNQEGEGEGEGEGMIALYCWHVFALIFAFKYTLIMLWPVAVALRIQMLNL
jgi:hypothetical protein